LIISLNFALSQRNLGGAKEKIANIFLNLSPFLIFKNSAIDRDVVFCYTEKSENLANNLNKGGPKWTERLSIVAQWICSLA